MEVWLVEFIEPPVPWRTSTYRPPTQLLILECHEQWWAKKRVLPKVQMVSRFDGLSGKKSAHDGIGWAKLVFRFRQTHVSDPRHEQRKTKSIGYLFCLDSIPWTTSPVSVVQFDRVHVKIFHHDVEWHSSRMISPFEKKSTDILRYSHVPNTDKKTPVKLQAFPAVVANSILGRRNCNWKMICTTW